MDRAEDTAGQEADPATACRSGTQGLFYIKDSDLAAESTSHSSTDDDDDGNGDDGDGDDYADGRDSPHPPGNLIQKHHLHHRRFSHPSDNHSNSSRSSSSRNIHSIYDRNTDREPISSNRSYTDSDVGGRMIRGRGRRNSLEEGYPWSPWSGWRLILRLLYAVVVPAVIIFLLGRFERSLQQQQHYLLHQQQQYEHFQQVRCGQGEMDSCAPLSSRGQDQPLLVQHGEGDESSSPWRQTLLGTLERWRSHLHPRGHHQDQEQDRQRQQQQHHHDIRPKGTTMVQQTFFDNFVLFGDSITQYSFDVNERGFGAQLAHLFQRRLDIINRGFSGYTSEQAIHILPQLLPRVNSSLSSSADSLSPPKIQFLAIFFGANDACLSPSPQHVPLPRYIQNLHSLISMVHSPTSPTYSPETRIILFCSPPVDEARWAIRRKERGMFMDRDKEVTRTYAEACLKIGQEYRDKGRGEDGKKQELHRVDVIDTWGLMMQKVEAGERTLEDYLKDGLHLASEGNNLVFEEIMKIVRTRYPEYDPETMPMHAPWWGHLDHSHPETDLLICANKPAKS